MSDNNAKRYYFESSLKPAIFWVDLEKVGLEEGADVKVLDIMGPEVLAVEVSAKFQKEEPIVWIKP